MYFAVYDSMSLFISFSPIRYFAFRIVPVFSIIAIILGTSTTFSIKQRILAGLSIGILHALFTNLWALVKILKNDKTVFAYLNKPFQIFTHLFTFIIILFTSILAGTASHWGKIHLIVPDLNGLRDNLWSSVVAAMIGVWLYKLYKKDEVSTGSLFKKNIEKLSPEIIKTIEEESIKNKANTRLVKAICVVENIQRPSWIRKVEKIKSIFDKEGTYGIMQIKSSHYIGDRESIKIAVEKFFSNTEDKCWSDLEEIIFKYNSDKRYVEFVGHAFNYL